jgi:hypothetical protein
MHSLGCSFTLSLSLMLILGSITPHDVLIVDLWFLPWCPQTTQALSVNTFLHVHDCCTQLSVSLHTCNLHTGLS